LKALDWEQILAFFCCRSPLINTIEITFPPLTGGITQAIEIANSLNGPLGKIKNTTVHLKMNIALEGSLMPDFVYSQNPSSIPHIPNQTNANLLQFFPDFNPNVNSNINPDINPYINPDINPDIKLNIDSNITQNIKKNSYIKIQDDINNTLCNE